MMMVELLVEVSRLLIEEGVDMEARGIDGQTPLHNSAMHGQVEVSSRASVIFDVLSPTHSRLPITPRMDVPKDLSSKKSLEVA